MTDKDVDIIIAKYMDLYWVNYESIDRSLWHINKIPSNKHRVWDDCGPSLYTESLDALVPVWDKLTEVKYTKIEITQGFEWGKYQVTINKYPYYIGHGDTIQQAASYATAKAIQGLEK